MNINLFSELKFLRQMNKPIDNWMENEMTKAGKFLTCLDKAFSIDPHTGRIRPPKMFTSCNLLPTVQ